VLRLAFAALPFAVTLVMDGSLNVGALVVRGSVLWTDATQPAAEQWLCAGYVAVEDSAVFNVTVVSASAIVYLKANGMSHSELGARALGGIGVINAHGPRVTIAGRPLRRTWSLLATPASAGYAVALCDRGPASPPPATVARPLRRPSARMLERLDEQGHVDRAAARPARNELARG
jgi:hypothetical protein